MASCGSKAAACGRLLQLAQASGGLFKAPQGAVIPFGIMNLALKVRGCCIHLHAGADRPAHANSLFQQGSKGARPQASLQAAAETGLQLLAGQLL